MRPRMLVAVFAIVLLSAVGGVRAAEDEQSGISPAGEVRYVIERAEVRAAPSAESLRGTMSLQVRHLADGTTLVPLLPADVAVVSARASDGGWFRAEPVLVRQRGGVALLLSSKGEFSVEIEFATPVHSTLDASSAVLPAVPALSGTYEVTLPERNPRVELRPDLPFQTEAMGEHTLLRIFGAGERTITVQWQPAAEVQEVERVAFAEQQMLLRASPGVVRVEVEIRYELLQGRMPRLDIALPEGYSLLRVEGDDVRSWQMAEGDDGARLAVTLRNAQFAATSVRLALERTLGAVPVVIEAPAVVALGVSREKGTVAVALEGGLQAEVVERENVGQVNLSDLPDSLRRRQPAIGLALRYLSRPYRLSLRISPIRPQLYGEVSCLSIASLERFRQHWQVHYEIRNAGVFQLRLRLGPGMKLIGLDGPNINNQGLEPETNILTVDLRSKAEGSYTLNLQTHSAIPEPEHSKLPALELLDVERQWGTIGVAAEAGIAVETGAIEGVSQIDVAELQSMPHVQQAIRVQRAPQPALAFRYLSFPYSLGLMVSHVRPEVKVEPLHYVEITRKNLRYRSTFNYRIKKAGVFQLRLHVPRQLRGSLIVEGERVDDYSYDAASETLTVQLTERTLDELSVRLESEALLPAELPPPGESGPLAVPAVYALDCEQERGYIAIGTDESIRLKRAGAAGPLHDVDVQEIAPSLLHRAGNAKLAFRLIQSPWELELEATSISPKIQVQTFNYERFGEDYLIGATTIEFSIQYAGVKEFFVRLPQGVTEPNIRGENIKIQEKVKPAGGAPAGSGDLWRVELQSEVKGNYQLIIEYTMELDPQQTRRTFSGPKVVDEMKEVEREVGYLAVTADPSLELAPVPDEIRNLTPVDEEEIPRKFRELPQSVADQVGRRTVPILFAFRYLGHPYELALDAVRHDEAEVVTAVVESCKLDTTITEEGNRITTMIADVRSRYQSFLEVELPTDARLWHALVNGQRVRPLTGSGAEGDVTKIPIAQVQGVTGTVRVELQWEEPAADDDGLGRVQNVRLAVPSLRGVRILRLGWVLQMPRGYEVIRSSGTLHHLPSEHHFEEALHRLTATSRPRGGAGAMMQTVDQGPAQQVSNLRILQGRAAGKAGMPGVAAVAAQKPQQPERFYFQALILNPQRPARAEVLCMDGPARHLLTAAEVLLVAALCLVFWHVAPFGAPARMGALTAVALLLTGVKVAAEMDYALFLRAALVTVVATALALAALSVAQFLQARHRAEPS